jgi:hypothetical protein
LPSWFSSYPGFPIAFAVAVLAIYLDCYELINKSYRNVPRQFFTSGVVLLLACFCGLIAATAYFWTDPKGESWIDHLLTLQIENPYSRALYVGAAVLVLIRSQLFQLKGINFGAEAIYTRAREKALNKVTLHWLDWRDKFVADNIERTFAVPDFDTRMVNRMKAIAAQSSDSDYRATVERQVAAVETKRPSGARASTDQVWKTYHETITTMTLDICGTQPFKALPDFVWP